MAAHRLLLLLPKVTTARPPPITGTLSRAAALRATLLPPTTLRRNAGKGGAAPLCPTGLDACPVAGLSANDYECIDTAVELESCGGCASLGEGQDCTAIKGAWNVGCEQGRCAVYTCTFGFKRAPDGQSCISL
ncbi:hypothetical protein B0H19DRAFT_1254736 [Mycena capillaripes]|nr:hypothetical protein B0H19DRAFT_1254736 [Mycena capillaripes]